MESTTSIAASAEASETKPVISSTKPKHAYEGGPRSLKGVSRWAVISLTAFMIAEFVFICISGFLIWLYLPSTVVPFSQSQLEMIDYFIIGAGIVQTALFWLSVIFVGRVTFRAMKNLHTVGSKHPEMSPGWAVGWYFVPIANLWQPAQGMSQIYNGTYDAVGEATPAGSRIAIWWTCWILTNISANVALRIGGLDNTGFGITSFSFDGISSFFGVLSAWALIRLIRPITEKQELLKHGGVAHVFD